MPVGTASARGTQGCVLTRGGVEYFSTQSANKGVRGKFGHCGIQIRYCGPFPTGPHGRMPRDGAITFSNLLGKLDMLVVEYAKRVRTGRYAVRRLIDQRGRDGKLIDWTDELPANCPRKIARNFNDQCRARCPDLPKVL